MAEKISHIKRVEVPEESLHEQNLSEVAKAVSDNKDAILKGIGLLDTLNQSGTLDMIDALVKHREQALGNVMREINQPQYATILENLPRLLFLLGELDLEEIEQFTTRLQHGVKEAAAAEDADKTSYMDLIKALKNPEINRSITMLLEFLRGMGRE
ncbi:DUF1641 domain-containing protein [Lentibacillus salinarum]|uniref:DUF1641 domain-containing protein n=1 Tax=Lentibacillus salinarum TaxID=446820 RepID=A0ABW3ZUR7_9BACI